MSASPTPLQLDSVDFAFGSGVRIAEGLDLVVETGSLTALLGPSGCGKSTVLRLVAGLLEPQGGQLTGVPAARAFVFQQPTLLPWRSVRDNVGLAHELGAAKGLSVDDALDLVGLGDTHELLPRQLSGGMQMRTSLARALVTRPDLMLLDEPFGALDALTRRRLHAEFLAIRAQRPFTALLVTHDIEEALYLADRVVVFSGPPLTIVRDLAVPFPRPRSPELRHDVELGRMARELEALL